MDDGSGQSLLDELTSAPPPNSFLDGLTSAPSSPDFTGSASNLPMYVAIGAGILALIAVIDLIKR